MKKCFLKNSTHGRQRMQKNEDVAGDKPVPSNDVRLFAMIILMVIIISMMSLTSCSLSFSNVMTSGTASDVVDSDPSTDTTANPNLTIPTGL